MTILDFAQRNGRTYKRVSAVNGGEYHGPCPACGGSDRFHVWPRQGSHGTFWCRQCDKAGDAIEYLMVYERLGFRVAAAAVGKEVQDQDEHQRPRFRKQGHSVEAFQPRQCADPADLWQEHAGKLASWAHQQLLADQPRLDWLAARGLDIEAVKRYTLGWNPGERNKDLYRAREAWGLETVLKEDGKKKKIWLPIGLTIPYYQGGRLHRIRIRRPDGDPRYYVVPGSGAAPMVQGVAARAFVIVESELDALLIHHVAGDMVGSISQGNSTARPDESSHAVLKASLAILVALDSDEAGMQASVWWRKQYPQAERWPVPVGKDPGESYQAGIDIREWVAAGLPPVLTLPPKPRPVPVVRGEEHDHAGNAALVLAPATGDGAEQPVVAKLRTKAGDDFWVTNIPEEYLRLQAEGETVFSPTEIEIAKTAKAAGATEHEIRMIFAAKRIFSGVVGGIESVSERDEDNFAAARGEGEARAGMNRAARRWTSTAVD